MTEHPSAYRLEALSAGAPDPEATAHLEACEACADYLTSLAADRVSFAELPPPDFLVVPPNVLPFERQETASSSREHATAVSAGDRWRGLSRAVWPVAAAALVVLLVLRPDDPSPADRSAPESGLRAKGAPTLRVVRERGGLQSREDGRVTVRPGDRLRFEVQMPSTGEVSIVLWPDAGGPEAVVSRRALTAGTHLLDTTVSVDAAPTHGLICAGPPAEVEGPARPTAGGAVTAIRVDSELAP